MTWLLLGIAGVCLIIVLGAVPELLAGTLTAVCILLPYYQLHERAPNMENALNVEQRNGELYITNAPLPERIEIHRELWDHAEPYDPEVDADTGIAPPAIWREEIGHAGSEVKDADGNVLTAAKPNDGYVLHIDASNVTCSYRVAGVPEEGPIVGVLQSWGEK